MLIYLHSVHRENNPNSQAGFQLAIEELAKHDISRRHQLTQDVEAADIILVTDAQSHLDNWCYSKMRASAFLRRWQHKAYVYCDADKPIFLLPGLYPSVSRRLHDPNRQASFCYLGITWFEGDDLFDRADPDLLFSFSGQLQNHRCRTRLRALKSERGEIVDTSGNYIFDIDDVGRKELMDKYRIQLARSKFVLCPRGVGTSSYRLFEVMSAGRVPVIISDDWVEPQGPAWDQFSIRIPEKRVGAISDYLSSAESRFYEMSIRCKQEFYQYFSRAHQFNYMGNVLERLIETRGSRSIRFSARRSFALGLAATRECRRHLAATARSVRAPAA